MIDFIENPPDELWEWTAAASPAAPVRVVTAAGGFVAAAGDALHMLRPGARRLRTRELPAPALEGTMGEPSSKIIAMAAEPWSPFRLAIASRGRVGIYTGHRPWEPVIALGLADPEHDVSHFAWRRHEGSSVLYMRQRTGSVSRLRMDGKTEVLNAPNASAIAADEEGFLGLISLIPPDEAQAWLLPAGGEEFDVRGMVSNPYDDDIASWNVHLAVQGTALAYSLDDLSAEVSWARHKDERLHFEMVPSVFQGPIAFGGDGVMYAAYNVEGQVNVLCHVRDGGVVRIGRFGFDDAWKGVAATVTSIAWDEERGRLWAASPELGLLELRAPGRRPGDRSAN